LVVTNAEGEEVPFFSAKFLIMKYLKMSEADLELNEKYKKEEELSSKSNEGDDSGDEDSEGDEELGGDDESTEDGSESDESSDEIDDEMLGDVQPESPETTEV
jgi:hypothetical protein